jgi:hypothetical protein
MSVLEQISRMKQEGKNDEEIVISLREQGVTPKAINDAFSQAKIKSAVSDTQEDQEQFNREVGMSPSSDDPAFEPPLAPTAGQTKDISESEFYSAQPQQQEFYPQQQGETATEQEYYPADYGSQGYSSQGFDSNMMIEIAEQIFSEKSSEIRKQLEDLNEFKVLTQTKLDSIEERTKRIETMMDKLQLAILDKIGSYGRNLESIKREMTMMEDSFGKLVNPFVERKAIHQTHKTTPHKKPVKRKTRKKK